MAEVAALSLPRAEREKLKKKLRKKKKQERRKEFDNLKEKIKESLETPTQSDTDDFEIEYVSADPFENKSATEFEKFYVEFKDVFDYFNTSENQDELPEDDNKNQPEVKEVKLSKKKRKLQRRLPVAVLKQLVERPDLVEAHDACAANPFMVCHLKAYRNTIPVPRHWSQKRKYLQGKRGVEKGPFELPSFIKKTGIMEIRNHTLDKEGEKKLKQLGREKMNPHMGKIDIDYQVLHDAFFRYQTKPKMTGFGDVYFEGKEYEVELLEKRPGIISKALREALGMPDGAPPPWLHNMQRIGPPPSYPTLKIPGLNAPIPPGAEYGFQPGGWGRPPADINGRPLFIEAYGEQMETAPASQFIEFEHWGTLQQEEEVSSEEEEAEGLIPEPEKKPSQYPDQMEGIITPFDGLETPISGLETPENLESSLRKRKVKDTESVPPPPPPEPEENKELFQVLETRQTGISGDIYGSSHTYVLDKKKTKKVPIPSDVVDTMKSQATKEYEISLDPSEVANLTEEGLKKQFEKAVESQKQQQSKEPAEDSDEESSKKRKRLSKGDSNKRPAKRQEKEKRDFKF